MPTRRETLNNVLQRWEGVAAHIRDCGDWNDELERLWRRARVAIHVAIDHVDRDDVRAAEGIDLEIARRLNAVARGVGAIHEEPQSQREIDD